MTGLLARQQPVSRKRDMRRLVVAGVLLLAASAAWHAVLPSITLLTARSSIGSWERRWLLVDAIGRLYPNHPVWRDEFFDFPNLWSWRLPDGGLVTWLDAGAAAEPVAERTMDFADDRLLYLGSLAGCVHAIPRPEGFDARGVITLLVMYEPDSGCQDGGCAVLRFAGQSSSVAGLIVSDANKIDWADVDGDGATELVFGRTAPRHARQRVSAAFRLDGNGVPLPPDRFPNGAVYFWVPPEREPIPIPDGTPVDEFCRTLAPWPDAFIAPVSSAPASAPS